MPGAKIEDDVFVTVYSDQLPAAGTLAAKAVRVVKMPTLEGRRLHIGGLVTEAAADGKARTGADRTTDAHQQGRRVVDGAGAVDGVPSRERGREPSAPRRRALAPWRRLR